MDQAFFFLAVFFFAAFFFAAFPAVAGFPTEAFARRVVPARFTFTPTRD